MVVATMFGHPCRTSITYPIGRRPAPALIALAAALLIGSAGAAGSEPVLVSAAAQRHHVVVTFSVHDATPSELVVATSPRVDALGALLVGVKLREKVRLAST